MANRVRSLKNQIPDFLDADEKILHRLQGKTPYISLPFWAGIILLVLAQTNLAETWLSIQVEFLFQLLASALPLIGLYLQVRARATRQLVVTNKRVLLFLHTGKPFCALAESLQLDDARLGRVSILNIPASTRPAGFFWPVDLWFGNRPAYVQLRIRSNTGTARIAFEVFNPVDSSGRSTRRFASIFEVARALNATPIPPSNIDHLDRLAITLRKAWPAE